MTAYRRKEYEGSIMGKYVVRMVKSGFRFDLKAGNGQIIASSEGYTTKAACLSGIESVKKNAPLAVVEDQTEAGFVKAKHPKFEVCRDKAGEFRFRLKAGNGQVIAVSEGYGSKGACLTGVKSVRRNAKTDTVIDEGE